MTAPAAPVRLGRNHSVAWRRVTRGVHRPCSAAPDLHAELLAWQSVLPPTAAFTGLTGAAVRGWWLPPLPGTTPVILGLPHDVPRPRRPGLLVRRHPGDVGHDVLGGLRVATPAEILLTAARDLGLLDLVVVLDAALHAGDCDLATLTDSVRTRRRAAPMLRHALPYCDGRSESAWESVLRMLLVTCAVPVQPQFIVQDDDGCFLARADLRIGGTRRLMEYDGGTHRRPRQHVRDLARDRRLLRAGWERFGYSSDVVLHSPVSVLREADEALGRPHRPDRLRPWHRLLVGSCFTTAGRARLARRWSEAAVGSLGRGQRTPTGTR